MARYVRVLDTASGVPRVADTLAEWVDVNDLIEIPEGGGITNSTPVGDINGVNQVFVFNLLSLRQQRSGQFYWRPCEQHSKGRGFLRHY